MTDQRFTLASRSDAYRFYVDQRITWPPVTRWRRFVAWFKRAILRRKVPVMVVTAVDVENGIVTVESGHK